MNTVKSLFGIRTKAEKQAAEQARQAQVSQARSAEQDAARLAGTQYAADRIARGKGRNVLAFNTDAGVPLAATLGGG